MIVKKCLCSFLVVLLLCSVCAGLVVGSEGDGISEYIEVPEGSPSPSPSPNATVTPNATVSPSTVYVGLDRVQSINPFGNPKGFRALILLGIRLLFRLIIRLLLLCVLLRL